jgi:maltose alpha-D-glucosyltransferase/alpha-amylase
LHRLHEDPLRAPVPDLTWHQDAVIYQLHVRTFRDGNGDGVGDFIGLRDSLDYLAGLGVTCLWLLPFCASPRRDDGYDVADYRTVHPDYGTLDDVRTFLDAAHARGIRVMSELVINHTSDQHAWFQAARRAAPGSRERDFYVWSDTTDRYRGARIIFDDAETSNWTWDPVAGAYYWHRFFHHQPDLNFESEDVQQAVIDVMQFWLDLGMDGLRLDAVAHLFEREGTTCDNLPETHAFLRKLRAALEASHPDRVLLAEVNQPPPLLREYFGAGDECHMAFHFPLVPRLFLAMARGTAGPIVEVLRATPPLPDRCQWAVFWRNHDDLSLSAVAPHDRALLAGVYAPDPQMRLNGDGIRRRLAPLLGHDRARLELAHALLLSLPGSPVLYYGDEVAMADDPSLPDRDGLRLPMAWDRVDAGGERADSLLVRVRHMIAIRQRSGVFGRGTLEWVDPGNDHVLAFVRRLGDDAVLVLSNLSGDAQPVTLRLGDGGESAASDLLSADSGMLALPSPATLTLPPYGSRWLELISAEPGLSRLAASRPSRASTSARTIRDPRAYRT